MDNIEVDEQPSGNEDDKEEENEKKEHSDSSNEDEKVIIVNDHISHRVVLPDKTMETKRMRKKTNKRLVVMKSKKRVVLSSVTKTKTKGRTRRSLAMHTKVMMKREMMIQMRVQR